jgi:hypothetical protein
MAMKKLLEFSSTEQTAAALPDFREVFESLEIVFLLNPTFNTEFSQDSHHLTKRKSRKLRGSTHRRFPILISLHGDQESASGN